MTLVVLTLFITIPEFTGHGWFSLTFANWEV